MTMLDETTCPVCGKNLGPPHESGYTASHDFSARFAHWAVAHYLAHLVQQQQKPPTFEERMQAIDDEFDRLNRPV